MLLGLPAHQVSLTGTVLSFALFLLVMPRWAAVRWAAKQPWADLGIRNPATETITATAAALIQGLVIAAGLLSLITTLVLIGGWGHWLGHLDGLHALNAVLLCFGVGFAEELIFRGWLWTELNRTVGTHRGAMAQAILFSLVHTRFNLGLPAMIGLLIGLLLLGLVLASRRRSDRGSLWGCIGLHGGLVGGWFLLQNGLLAINAQTPAWLIGPGGSHANPLGGVVAVVALTVLLRLESRIRRGHPSVQP
jgi:hypothetical protein